MLGVRLVCSILLPLPSELDLALSLVLAGGLGYLVGLLFERQREEAFLDPLTQAYTRVFLTTELERQLVLAYRYNFPVSLIMIDMDRFKTINDTLGHLVGDETLRALALRLKSQLRQSDALVRYGGDEFLLVLPHTSSGDATLLLDRIKKAMASVDGEPVTFSAGGATFPDNGTDVQTLLLAADEALRAAKKQGDCINWAPLHASPSGAMG